MHSNLFILLWRRKLSVLLISSSLMLFALWTWAFLENNNNNSNNNQNFVEDGHILKDFSNDGNTKNHAYLLQRLISQANRVLRYQRSHSEQSKPATGGIPVPAAAHTGNSAKISSLVRFIKPTKSPPAPALVEEASAQTLSLVARRKKVPLVGESYLFEEERLRILENQQRIRNAAAGALDELNNNMDYERSMMNSAERQSQYEHELQRMGVPVIAGLGPEDARAPNERLVHLDLKGAPPKLSFLKHLLPVLKTLGATGLLIEYEDMFPYTGALEVLSAKNAYKPDELKDFLETAAFQYGLSIIPLIQTFGHIEYALKLQGFEHMREIPESPQSLCPSQKNSIAFIEEMLTQVIEFHLGLGLQDVNSTKSGATTSSGGSTAPLEAVKFTHIHIGCDEVYRMGECEKCRQYARNEIFLRHVTTVASFVRSHWPLQVIIWDDMLRDMTLSEMQHSHIGNYVEPMIWVYVSDIYHFIRPQLWDFYAKVFPTAWAASAFKGAFGESLMIPPLQRHLENNIKWLAIIAKEGGRFSKGFKGLALTGWQRYDHFAVLCELLPVGIPSLITTLSTVSKGYFATNAKENAMLKVLHCAFHPDSRRSGHPWIELQPNSHHSQLFTTCSYPGSHTYDYALRVFDKITEAQTYLLHVQDKSGWMSDYNVRHNFSSPIRVHSLTANTPALISELSGMAREAQAVMHDIYDGYTIAEFVEQNIYPTIIMLRKQLERAQFLLQPNAWPQRPLPYARELVDLNLIPNDEIAMLEQQHTQQQQQQQQQQQAQQQLQHQ